MQSEQEFCQLAMLGLTVANPRGSGGAQESLPWLLQFLQPAIASC